MSPGCGTKSSRWTVACANSAERSRRRTAVQSLLNPFAKAEALVGRIRREAERNALRARNGIKVATGIDSVPVGATPKDVLWTEDRCSLGRYRSEQVRWSPPLFICFSLISRSYILDLHPGNSF